jgi:formamidopyrimidine-DNA glycosylase
LPELPEVETVVRSIRPHLEGRTITGAEVSSRRVTRGDHQATQAGLTGATITVVRRRGKQIFVDLSAGHLYIHLGMTGKLLWNGERTKFTRAALHLEDGTLLFDDIRQFGRFEFYAELPPILTDKGPDALRLDFDTFFSRLQRHRGFIKTVLLHQGFISGVGNIYADEALFSARIHPRTLVRRVSRRRAAVLYQALQEILKLAIDARGSSISDYVDSEGQRGSFQQQHQVYGRAGEPCPACGKAIRRIVLGQRGTHYCANCQRA